MDKRLARDKRHKRVRYKISGTTERPRLSVYRSLKHTYAQVIDDFVGETLASASTLDWEIREELSTTGNKEAAKLVGQLLGRRAQEKGIERVVFDRGGNKYHGRIQAVAEGARESGLIL